jgi:hypothetical protein
MQKEAFEKSEYLRVKWDKEIGYFGWYSLIYLFKYLIDWAEPSKF